MSRSDDRQLEEAEHVNLGARIDGRIELDDERWQAHARDHAVVADALKEYKMSANSRNELVAGIRGDFLSLAEWRAEHKALLTRVEALERVTAGNLVESTTVRDIFTNARNLILLAIAVVGVIVSVIVFVRG